MGIEHWETSGVPRRHKCFRLSDNLSEEWLVQYNALKSKLLSGPLVAILGNRGSGKTQLGVALIGHATLNCDLSARYYKAMEIFLRIRESLKAPGDSELAAVKEFIRPRVLVIDAFEVRSETPFENRELDHIIDKRYDDSNATIIISNHTIKEFTNQVGPSIADRMRENGGIVTLTNSSFRNRQGV